MRASWGVRSQWRCGAGLGAWLLWLCLAAVSCASVPEVPSRGGPRWLRLTSEHFVLLTDAPDARARQASVRLERQLHALCELSFRCRGQLQLSLRVIALSDREQFERAFGAAHGGVAHPDVLFEPLVVLTEGAASESLSTLNRMIAVHLAARGLGPLPRWLEHGIGAYFESAHYESDATFVVGAVPRRHAQWLRTHPRVPVAQLLDPQARLADPESIAPSAWLLVHYLMSERSSDFAAFQDAVASGKDLSASFHEAFGDLSPERLDGLLDRYAQAGNYLSQSQRIATPDSAPQIEALSDADVYELRAELGALCLDCDADRAREVDEDLERALASDPRHLRAALLRAQRATTPSAEQLARAEQLTREHPDAALAYLQLARLRDRTEHRQRCAPELLARLESLAPDNAHALSLRARCEQREGRHAAALALSERALARAPTDPGFTLAHAELLHAQHACAELARLLERIRSGTHDAQQTARLERCETPSGADQAQKTTAERP